MKSSIRKNKTDGASRTMQKMLLRPVLKQSVWPNHRKRVKSEENSALLTENRINVHPTFSSRCSVGFWNYK